MTVIVAGTVRIPHDRIPDLRPHLEAMAAATRAEDGCHLYSFAEDLLDPGLLRVFEVWRDQAALDAHFKTEHIARWRAVFPDLGITDRALLRYTADDGAPT